LCGFRQRSARVVVAVFAIVASGQHTGVQDRGVGAETTDAHSRFGRHDSLRKGIGVDIGQSTSVL
jgi:hypothetical protein